MDWEVLGWPKCMIAAYGQILQAGIEIYFGLRLKSV